MLLNVDNEMKKYLCTQIIKSGIEIIHGYFEMESAIMKIIV